MNLALANISSEMVPILLVLLTFGLLALHQVLRYRTRALVHQERLLAMEKGLELPQDLAQAPLAPHVCLLRGILGVSIGIAIMIACLTIAFVARSNDRDRVTAMAWAMLGVLPLGVGSAYLLYYRLQMKQGPRG